MASVFHPQSAVIFVNATEVATLTGIGALSDQALWDIAEIIKTDTSTTGATSVSKAYQEDVPEPS